MGLHESFEDRVQPGSLDLLDDCEICKLEISDNQKNTICVHCEANYHLNHLRAYFDAQEHRNLPKNCVVCQTPFPSKFVNHLVEKDS